MGYNGSMRLLFTKMHGTGNDFMVINAIAQPLHLSATQIAHLAHRQFGVGFDQLLLVEYSSIVDFKYRIFNADGSEVGQCGNGARCFMRFVHDKQLHTARTLRVETLSGIITLHLADSGLVTVDMGAPILVASAIPFIAEDNGATFNTTLATSVGDIALSTLSMGNPHAVLVVSDVTQAPVATLGAELSRHPNFPAGANVGFMQVKTPHQILLRVFERGSGETLACGTGACAAVVSGIINGMLQSPVTVHVRGGILHITWCGADQSVLMSGDAQTVFEGQIDLA